MKLIVGLGNPGKKYDGTRHNVGFEVLDRLAAESLADPPQNRFDGAVRQCRIGSESVLLLAPHTYMNLSGGSVLAAVDFYKLAPADLLVVCDDFNLPVGSLRLRPRGTEGGQRGLADVIRRLGTNEFARLRIGIGPVPERWNPADFVLGKFTADERPEMDLQVARAVDAAKCWATAGVDEAMCRFNGAGP
ncbi:MAG: aminoacyl-tRNA hydrolase [Pirellulales bacterium]|nr:aminoacyl-tRNA hydrolase [Pirellulales bacterium]MBX3434449.1 aminoacyl-tRNA hydrolase [Pirellulales bacterium]